MSDVREWEARLRDALSETTGKPLEGIGVDEDLVTALGLDSLGGLRVLAAVEKRFGVRFPDDQLGRLRTLRDMLAHLPRGEEPT